MSRKSLKSEAKEILKGNWMSVATITCIFMIITLVFQIVSTFLPPTLSSILNIVYVIIVPALAYGLIMSFINIRKGKEIGYIDFITDGLKNFNKAWGVIGATISKLAIWILLLIMTYSFLFLAFVMVMMNIKFGGLLLVLSCIAVPAAFIGLFIRSLLYTNSYYIMYENDNKITAKQAVERSEELMEGRKKEYFILSLSFIGWILLSIITLGVGYAWLIPYMTIVMLLFYEKISESSKVGSIAINVEKDEEIQKVPEDFALGYRSIETEDDSQNTELPIKGQIEIEEAKEENGE